MRTRSFARCVAAVAVLVALCAPSIAQEEARRTRRDGDQPLNSALRRNLEEGRESDNPLARQQWFMHGRTVDHGSSAEYLQRAWEQKMMQRAMRRMQTQTQSQPTGTFQIQPQANVLSNPTWTNVGPAPLNSNYYGDSIANGYGSQDYGMVSGRVTAITVDPNDATGNTVYAAGAYGGVWKSTNGAQSTASVTWTPIMDGQATLAVNAVTVQPGNATNILVGTGEPNNAIDSYYGLGILHSTDAGAHWTLISTVDSNAMRGLGVYKFAWASPDNSNLVVAALGFGDSAGTGRGLSQSAVNLVYSNDAGATWHVASISPNTASVTDVVYNPFAHKFFAAVRNNGLYSSSDGINWSKVAVQPGTLSGNMYRGELAVLPTANEMYIWYINSSLTDLGVYQSKDGGASWNTISTADMDTCDAGDACGPTQGYYNLFLAAVPESGGTALYAGAVNLFKCVVSSTNPDCSKNAAGSNWLNLTHVYSCAPTLPYGALAHVHPDEHGIDFSRSHPEIIYFGNDGGVYRTLNGPGLNTGSCSATLPFDNLNATMGSLTQFYAMTGHPTDPTILVGGSQDNGTGAVSTTSGLQWQAIQGGDGSYSAIDPNNPNTWYVSFTNSGANLRIFVSTLGISSRGGTFGSPVITASSNLGGDTSDWVTPFKLDPADSTKIIIGTCRVWRGPASGTGWTSSNALSNNFGTGDSSACTSSSSHSYIRALAVGGPKTSNGSQVIYAGSEYGHVFATTNADGGASAWTDVLVQAGSNPISSLTIDPSDSTGKTVYATAMGFGQPHVYKSTNGGTSWTNISGDLPDVPTNAVAVDPGNASIVYVGTDIGVYATQNGGTNWVEFGTGLPNSSVFALDTFNSTTTHLLRAATHGRGVWSTTLGSAATASGSLAYSPSFVTFINQAVGTTSASQTITVTVSQAAVTFTSVTSASANFPIATTCTGTIAAGNTCTIIVSYAPTVTGAQSSTISVASNAAGSPQTLQLAGNATGTAADGTITPETGWWWDQYLPGMGFFIEYRPASTGVARGIAITGFLYSGNCTLSGTTGNCTSTATWLLELTAAGSWTGTNTFSGHWYQCSAGSSIFGAYAGQPGCTNPASLPLSITFTDAQHGSMVRPDGTTINLTRFPFSTDPNNPVPPQAGAPQSGFWWNQAQNGSGYGIEFQGSSILIIAYTYDAGGNAMWYLSLGGMATPTTYTGAQWQTYSNGPVFAPTGSAECPTARGCYTATGPVNFKPLSLSFTGPVNGTIITTDTNGNPLTIPITRFSGF